VVSAGFASHTSDSDQFWKVSCGNGACCALMSTGTAVCAGSLIGNVFATPSFTFADLSITSEGKTACGIRANDSRVICWGLLAGAINKVYESDSAGPITQLSASSKFVCGIVNSTGVMGCAYQSKELSTVAGAPAPETLFSELRISHGRFCAVTTTAEVICWGSSAALRFVAKTFNAYSDDT
jgi:hypothetical protein